MFPYIVFELVGSFIPTNYVYSRKYDYEDVPAPAKKRGSSKRMRQGSLCEAAEPELPKLGGIFRQPPTGQKRFVYLDPRQPKYGFRLEVLLSVHIT